MKIKLFALGAAIVAASGVHLAAAQTSGAPGAPASTLPPAGRYVHGLDLLSTEERQSFHDRMRKAQTREERLQIREAMRALVEERAKEKGVALPPGHGGGPRGGYGPGPGAGPRAGAGPDGGWGRVYDRLFTEDERDAFRAKMQGAQTAEERAALWREQRALAEQRAQEKGIALPSNRGPGRGPGASDGRVGARGPGGAYSRLFTPEERDRFMARMHAATSPAEREQLWREHRDLAEQRAKEKGLVLPPRPGAGRGSAPRGESPATVSPTPGSPARTE